MDDRDVARFWNANAPGWVAGVRGGWDVYREGLNNPAFLGMLPEVTGLRLLDVGCGEGHNTRLFADRVGPAGRVVGADVAEGMIAAARQAEADQPRGIEYHVASANAMDMLSDASFDAVVSTMALMDLADYAGAIREIARVLTPGGFVQFSICHPCFITRNRRWLTDEEGNRYGSVVTDYFGLLASDGGQDMEQWYFTEAPEEIRDQHGPFQVPVFYRTLSEYVNGLCEAGLAVTGMCEPCATVEQARRFPAVADSRVVPIFLIVQARKPA